MSCPHRRRLGICRSECDSPSRIVFRRRWNWNVRLLKLVEHCWRGLIQLVLAASWQDSVISAKWNFSWKLDSLPWRPFISPRRMARDFYKRKTGLARWLRGSAPTWWSFVETHPPEYLKSKTWKSSLRMALVSIQRN